MPVVKEYPRRSVSAADPATRVIVLVSKPPAPSVARRVLEAARECGKPVVVNFLGASAISAEANLVHGGRREGAALAAVARARGEPIPSVPWAVSVDLLAAASEESSRLTHGSRRIAGLFSGGTLCKEASHILAGTDHQVLDLGDDEFTVGRPHPMIDARLRCERIASVGVDPTAGVLLLDVVLGYGSHPDPPGPPAIS